MNDRTKPVSPWETIDVAPAYGCRIFSLSRRRSRSPRTGEIHDFHVIESPDWVNIIPLTEDGQVVMVRQFRHGIGGVTLEVPGGMVDREDLSPLAAARREMQEETGYDSDDVMTLGSIHPNPAIQNNRCHSFLARGVSPKFPVRFDGTEETEVTLVPLTRVPELIRTAAISHALVVVAFHWLSLSGLSRDSARER